MMWFVTNSAKTAFEKTHVNKQLTYFVSEAEIRHWHTTLDVASYRICKLVIDAANDTI